MQIHYNCLRGVNRKMNALLGPDTGFDMINTASCGGEIAALLSALNDTDECPKTIIYSLNPVRRRADRHHPGLLPERARSRARSSTAPRGGSTTRRSAWKSQMSRLASLGLLGNFVGMLTDSRSFLSYTRHDYFRRILCNLIGRVGRGRRVSQRREGSGEDRPAGSASTTQSATSLCKLCGKRFLLST